MEKKRKLTTSKTILTSSVIAGTLFGISSLKTSASTLFDYSSLGTGSEIRMDLLEDDYSANAYEMKCGSSTDSTKTKDHKCGKDGKCGEGKCGDKHKDGKCGDKHKDGKCGEGKCGEKKKEEKKSK
jgi:uncharacterized low-complexity protein